MYPQPGQRTDAKNLPQCRQAFSFWPTSLPQLSQKKRGFLLIGDWGLEWRRHYCWRFFLLRLWGLEDWGHYSLLSCLLFFLLSSLFSFLPPTLLAPSLVCRWHKNRSLWKLPRHRPRQACVPVSRIQDTFWLVRRSSTEKPRSGGCIFYIHIHRWAWNLL